MTITQLSYIIALDTYRHFSKAADKCSVTQPTLSIQIQKLESELKVIIFDRTKKPLVPTEEGLLLIEEAKKVIAAFKGFQNTALNIHKELSGQLRIAILPSLAPYLLPLFIGNFAKKYPQVKVEIMELHNYQIIGRLQQDTADVAITIAPTLIDGFYEIPVFKENIVVYLSPNHPLAEKIALSINDIELGELLVTDDAKSMRNVLATLQGHEGDIETKGNLIYRSGSLETIRKIVEREGGIMLLPQLATLYMGDRRKQFVRYFNDPQPTRQIVLLTQRGFQKQRLVDALRMEISRSVRRISNSLM